MPDTQKSKTQVGWVIITFKEVLLRMNVQTGQTWSFEKGVWLPIKEKV